MQPCGEPVLKTTSSHKHEPILSLWGLRVKKLKIHSHTASHKPRHCSLWMRLEKLVQSTQSPLCTGLLVRCPEIVYTGQQKEREGRTQRLNVKKRGVVSGEKI